jgi:hypothetical protein
VNTGAVTTLLSGLTATVGGVARDPATGDLYFIEPTTIRKLAAGATSATTVSSGFTNLDGIAFTPSALFVSSTTTGPAGVVTKVPFTGSNTVLTSSLTSANGIAADAATGDV